MSALLNYHFVVLLKTLQVGQQVAQSKASNPTGPNEQFDSWAQWFETQAGHLCVCVSKSPKRRMEEKTAAWSSPLRVISLPLSLSGPTPFLQQEHVPYNKI